MRGRCQPRTSSTRRTRSSSRWPLRGRRCSRRRAMRVRPTATTRSVRHPSSALAVDDPASQPFVTGVGGTNLQTATGPESTWNQGTVRAALSAGGGGISTTWPMPTWQTALAVTSGNSGTIVRRNPLGRCVARCPTSARPPSRPTATESSCARSVAHLRRHQRGCTDLGRADRVGRRDVGVRRAPDLVSSTRRSTSYARRGRLTSTTSPPATTTRSARTAASTQRAPGTTWPPGSGHRSAPTWPATCARDGWRAAWSLTTRRSTRRRGPLCTSPTRQARVATSRTVRSPSRCPRAGQPRRPLPARPATRPPRRRCVGQFEHDPGVRPHGRQSAAPSRSPTATPPAAAPGALSPSTAQTGDLHDVAEGHAAPAR